MGGDGGEKEAGWTSKSGIGFNWVSGERSPKTKTAGKTRPKKRKATTEKNWEMGRPLHVQGGKATSAKKQKKKQCPKYQGAQPYTISIKVRQH